MFAVGLSEYGMVEWLFPTRFLAQFGKVAKLDISCLSVLKPVLGKGR